MSAMATAVRTSQEFSLHTTLGPGPKPPTVHIKPAASPSSETATAASSRGPASASTNANSNPPQQTTESIGQGTLVIDIRSLSKTELLKLSTQPNRCAAEFGIHPVEPPEEMLQNHHTPAETFSMAGVSKENRYYKAWKNIVNNTKPITFDLHLTQGHTQPKAPAASSSGTGASRQGSAFLQPTPEQLHFNELLGEYLGRTVKPPRLSRSGRRLDLKRLYMEVMARNGHTAMSPPAWQELAAQVLGSSDLGPDLAAAYSFYLAPLEAATPWGTRPARVLDLLEALCGERAALKDLLVSPAAIDTAVAATKAALAAGQAASGSVAASTLHAVRAAAANPAGGALGALSGGALRAGKRPKVEDGVGGGEQGTEGAACGGSIGGEFQPAPEPALLLSYIATRSAPPGWGQKPPSYSTPSPFSPPPAPKAPALLSTTAMAGSKALALSRVGKVVATPKCMACKTCLNPQMKKACLINRQRLADGLPPVLPA